ncbi:MAG: polymerase sigma-70 factor, subfamily [Bacillota bacterium]|nr:polymerase sigma-70 factor, subfamily [Bacillota bacterium]MDK2925999.1 polymerase sigma-70 factor, subfamily [Bacillota bacterium]MDK2960849.1 polymerase sigma-70 factor, subfamily [Bacillota bacterium]
MAESTSPGKNAPALRVLFELFYEDAYRSAFMITRNHHQAEDVTQEAFLKAFTHLETLAQPRKFGAWLKSIVVRTAIDLLRREKRLVFSDELEEEPGDERPYPATFPLPEEELERSELRAEVRRVIAALPPKQQLVVVLKFYHGLKDAEIAALLQVSVGTVKSSTHRALLTLGKRLEPYVKNRPKRALDPASLEQRGVGK